MTMFATRRAESLADQDFVNRLVRLGLAGANQNAFAERQAVGLHRAFAAQRRRKFLGRHRLAGKRPGTRSRDAVFLHELLGENLGRLELRGLLVRPPDAQAVFLEQIHDAQRQRIVRADDREFDFLFLREREQLRQIFRADVHAFDRRAVFGEAFLRDAGVARRAPHLRDVRRLRQFPDQRVFAPARTDDENVSLPADYRTGSRKMSFRIHPQRRMTQSENAKTNNPCATRRGKVLR